MFSAWKSKKRGQAAFFSVSSGLKPPKAAQTLLHLGFFAQALLVGTQTLLVELLGDLGFEFFKCWQLGGANVVNPNDVKTKLGFDRGFGHLAFVQFQHDFGEHGTIGVRLQSALNRY